MAQVTPDAKIRLRAEFLRDWVKASPRYRSNAALCKEMGVDPTTLWSIKDGRREPSPKFIAALIHATGLTFDELFEIVRAEAVA